MPSTGVFERFVQTPPGNIEASRIVVAHRTLLVLLLVYALNYMDRQLVAILIQPIKHELGLSDTAAGLLYGLTFAVFYSFLGIPLARLADRSIRSRIITVSLALFSVMTAVSALASTYWHLVIARIGVAVGEAGTNPASHSMIADLYPVERRSTAMAVFAAGLHLGVLMGFLVGGFLGQSLGWRAVFLIAGAAGLLMAGVAAWALKEPERTGVSSKVVPAKRVSTAEAVSTLWRSASMRHLFAGGTIANVATTALLAWLPAFLMRTHGLSLSRTGMLLAVIIGFLGACGTLLGGSLADRLGARDPAWRLRCIALVFLIVTPLWTVAIAAQSSALAMPALALAGALIGFHVGPSFAMVQTLARADMRALAASFLIFLTNLVGVAVGPLLIGSLSDAWLEKYGAYSLRAALLIVPPLFVWAAVHYEVAARTLAAELGNSDTAATAQQHATTPEAQVAALT